MSFTIREKGNFYTHAVPAVLCIPALGYLLRAADTDLKFYASVIYCISFLLLFTASSLYHGVPQNDEQKKQWRKLDHASIYLMIAGTYTPTLFILFHGTLMWVLLGVQWGIALFGITMKLSGRLMNHRLSLSLYLAMSWMIVFVIKQMYDQLPIEALYWLFGGGLFYSVGAFFYNLDKKHPGKLYHEIWHLFVVGGASCHYYYTLNYLIIS